MKPAEFEAVARVVRRECGLVLTPDKGYLVDSRLMPLARRWAKPSVEALARELMVPDPPRDLVREVVEAMVTNETFFFRDRKPFDQLKEFILPRLLAARAARRVIRIWCAACSSGQEPYSIAMICKEMPQLAGWKVEILGTDISTEIIRQAKAGSYSQFEVQRGLPIQLLVKYFEQQGDRWQLDASIRSMVSFRQFNLLDSPDRLGSFDIVFCRNVLIYFDLPTKSGILGRVASVMAPDGILYLGGAETVLGVSDRFQPVRTQQGVYELVTSDTRQVPLRLVAG